MLFTIPMTSLYYDWDFVMSQKISRTFTYTYKCVSLVSKPIKYLEFCSPGWKKPLESLKMMWVVFHSTVVQVELRAQSSTWGCFAKGVDPTICNIKSHAWYSPHTFFSLWSCLSSSKGRGKKPPEGTWSWGQSEILCQGSWCVSRLLPLLSCLNPICKTFSHFSYSPTFVI